MTGGKASDGSSAGEKSGTSGAARPQRASGAVALFTELAARMRTPDEGELERACAAHPEHAAELRPLFAIWRLLLDRLPDVSASAASSLTLVLGGGSDLCDVVLE